MCTAYNQQPRTRQESEERLAQLIADHLGVRINPSRLGEFIRDKWGAVSILSHEIHAPLPAQTPVGKVRQP